MTPHEWNSWLAFALFAVPIAAISGPFAWAAIWILAGLALLATHPVAGIILLCVVVTHKILGWALRDYFAFLIGGFGLRASGATEGAVRAEKLRERFETRRRAKRIPPAPQKVAVAPKIKGFSSDQIEELRRRYPGKF
jgi:hypothetical protein